jgi:hypothetical protein
LIVPFTVSDVLVMMLSVNLGMEIAVLATVLMLLLVMLIEIELRRTRWIGGEADEWKRAPMNGRERRL